MKYILVVFLLINFFAKAQVPGKDSIFIKQWTSSYSSTNVQTGQTRGSSNTGYYFRLGRHSDFEMVKGKNYKLVMDAFPESAKKYKQCTNSAKQASIIGLTAIALVGTFIAGGIIGAKNITDNPSKGIPWLGVGIVSLGGIYVLPRISRKKAMKSLEYFEESAAVYNSLVKK